jgi:hypothetical protein
MLLDIIVLIISFLTTLLILKTFLISILSYLNYLNDLNQTHTSLLLIHSIQISNLFFYHESHIRSMVILFSHELS